MEMFGTLRSYPLFYVTTSPYIDGEWEEKKVGEGRW